MPVQFKTLTIDPNATTDPNTNYVNTYLTISSGQRLTVKAKGNVNLWPSGTAHWTDPIGDLEWTQQHGLYRGCDASSLVGKIGAGGSIICIKAFYDAVYSGPADVLYLGVNDGNPGDNRGYFEATVIIDAPGKPNHNGECPVCHDGKTTSPNPLELDDGNKVLAVSDLESQTAAGKLGFERYYNQSQRNNSRYQFMGLGWSHNHVYTLVIAGTSPNRTANIYLPNGGVLKLNESGANHFVALPGSTSEMNLSGSNYILTAQDKSQFTFEPATVSGEYRLRYRTWPSTERWTYTYLAGTDLVSLIEDGYGRQLKFSYQIPTGSNRQHVWRVGDQTASGLDTPTPSGRYVTFFYSPEKLGGVNYGTPPNQLQLLTGVRDTRGSDWTYQFYGHETAETDAAKRSLLTKRLSPSVDTTGDGVADGTLTLEELIYTLSGSTITAVTQKRGSALVQTDFAFQAGGRNQTTETTAGVLKTHSFANGVYLGDDSGNNENDLQRLQVLNENYRPVGQVDGRSNETRLEWNTGGKLLTNVTDALLHATTFNYNANDTLNYSLDTQLRKTEYTYGDANNPRLPTRIKVLDTNGTTVLRWQEFVYDLKGRTTEERLHDPANSAVVLQKVTRSYYTSGNGNGLLQTVTQLDLVNPANNTWTTYTYDTAGRVVKTQQSSTLGSCTTSYTVYDPAGLVVATICNYDPGTHPDPTTAAEASALYNPAFPDKNRVTTYGYDTLGRRVKTTVNDGAAFKQTSLTFYDALDRVVRTIANYTNQSGGAAESPGLWVWSAVRSRWEKSASDQTPISHGADNTQNIIGDTAYNARGMVRLRRDALGSVGLFGYDTAGRLVKTILSASQPTYNNDYGGDPTLGSYVASGEVDQDIITTQTYDAAGNLVRSVDPLGSVSYAVYDPLNRPVKTVRNAKDSATITLYDNDNSYSAANDPRSSGYVVSTTPDRDLVETIEYDSLGRVLRQIDVLGRVAYTAYDALGRASRAIANYLAQGSTDPANWVWANNRWENGAGSAINHGTTLDQNIITGTAYDASGRVLYTRDVLGRQMRLVYDGLGRQIKTIANYVEQGSPVVDPANWVWDTADNRWEDGAGNAINHGTNFDQNLITQTSYDANGRVQWTRDAQGRRTWHVYDSQGRQVKSIANCTYVSGTPAPEDPGYVGSANADEDIITRTVYDSQGRVWSTFDALNRETRFVYDTLGRRIRAITNYVAQGGTDPANWVWANNRWENGAGGAINHGASFDQNLIGDTTYDLAGRIASSRDTRGTQTTFTYDRAGRRLTVTQAANTPLASVSYTCYDKAGRALRTIQNYVAQGSTNPANWVWVTDHWEDGTGKVVSQGANADRNLITTYTLDRLGRQTAVADPLNNVTGTTYDKAGQVQSVSIPDDPTNVVSQYRYDGLRRRTRVVQSYVPQGSPVVDPASWVWDATDGRWEYGTNNPVQHGVNNDQNIIVLVSYDQGGRMTGLRDPRGNPTGYTYDRRDRRLSLTNPLSQVWQTAYTSVNNADRVTLTNPNGATHKVQRDFDKTGRLKSIQYLNETPKNTPDVLFGYDKAGSRTRMSEYTGAGFTNRVRETNYGYDAARRLTSAGFDNNGDGTVDETVSYQYDTGGQRTRLTLPGGLVLTYSYDGRGRLVSLADWDGHTSQFGHDAVGRPVATTRHNGLCSRYDYDPAGRLRQVRHHERNKMLARFVYTVNKRGSRTQAIEQAARPATVVSTMGISDPAVSYYRGAWSTVSGFKVTGDWWAGMRATFTGNEAALTLGVGADHGIFDIYVDGSLWESFDGYAAAAGERIINLYLDRGGAHTLDIRNRREHHHSSTGYVLRFKQLAVLNTVYDQWTINYGYDFLSRLLSASYVGATPSRSYTYQYDRAGNRTQEIATVGGTPTTTNYTYNAANQISNTGFAYDNNGNLTSDGVNSYTWNRANRLLSVNSTAYQYQYDGLGSRISQTVSGVITRYLLDVQPGLVFVLAATTDPNTTRYVHGPLGIHAREDPTGSWSWIAQDGLGSARMELSDVLAVNGVQHYVPYGVPFGTLGSFGPYQFTGEPMDTNGLLYLRNRYYSPALGVFPNLDPAEGNVEQIISLNRYGYVTGNVVSRADPSGLFGETPRKCDPCYQEDGCYETFHYNRLAAAQAANTLATIGSSFSTSGGLDPSKYYATTGEIGTNSTRFISISLSAGGFPMVKGTGSDSTSTTSLTGWFAKCLNAKFTGNKVWDVHDQLVKYLLGDSDVGADFDPSNLSQSNRIGEVGVEMLFPDIFGVLANRRAPDTLPKNLETEMLKWIRIRPGDYMFGKRSSGEPGQVGIHGFMITGIGPAVKCGATDTVSALDTSFLGAEAYSLGPKPSGDIISTVPVPYVADLYGVQRGTARPFYCTVLDMRASYPETDGFFAELRYWEFFRVPDQVSVPCERIFEPNVNAFTGTCS